MAQRILGIDLGSYLVKVALFEVGFRTTELKQVVSVPVADFAAEQESEPQPLPAAEEGEAAGDDALPSDASQDGAGDTEGDGDGEAGYGASEPFDNSAAVLGALQAALSKVGPKPDVSVLALPGEIISLRVLDFPFNDPRKIAAVLAYELEGQIPFDMEDIVFDYLLGSPSGTDGRALVAMTRVARGEAVLQAVRGVGLEPTALGVAPLSYGYLTAEAPAGDIPTVGVLDIGHDRTNLAVLRGSQVLLARTLMRGGAQITRGLARRYQVDLAQAEELKHTYGFIPGPGTPAVTPDYEPIAEVVQEEMAPLVRALRQSLLPLRHTPEEVPQRIYVCGGTSALRGLPEYLTAQLEIPVEAGLPPGAPAGVGARQGVLAVGLARSAVDRRQPSVDLRKGPLALQEDHSILRRRALYFTWSAVIVLGLLILNGFASLWVLRKEEDVLRRRLAHTTNQIFRTPMNDPEAVKRRINLALRQRKISTLPIPSSSAYAVLSEISRQVPSKKEVTLDITRLFIRSGKIDMEGTAKTATEVDKVVSALKKIPCFTKVHQGRVSDVTVREMVEGEVKTDKRRKFTVDITHECI